MTLPPHLQPFVVSTPSVIAERDGTLDLYLPEVTQRCPAILFVHGGPVPAQRQPTPREWPVFQGYGSLAAARGVVGVTVEHGLHDVSDYPQAAANIAAAVQTVRVHPRVDPDRLAIWFFSGGGVMMADWLRTPPRWLRCVAASYPLLVPFPGTADEARFRPSEAVAMAGALPIVLTRVGQEQALLAEAVEAFVVASKAAGAALDIIDVPDGRHAFDVLDPGEQSIAAVELAMEKVLRAIRS